MSEAHGSTPTGPSNPSLLYPMPEPFERLAAQLNDTTLQRSCANSVSATCDCASRVGVVSFGKPADLVGAVKARRIIGGDLAFSGVEGAVAMSIVAASQSSISTHRIFRHTSPPMLAHGKDIQEARCKGQEVLSSKLRTLRHGCEFGQVEIREGAAELKISSTTTYRW